MSPINQISSSSFEWWSSFVCSSGFDLFHDLFWTLYTLSEKCMIEAVDGTINQIPSSSIEWWSSSVCGSRFHPIHDIFWALWPSSKECMNEAVDGAINQISSSSSFEWWSSFVCSLHVPLFLDGFCSVVGRLAGWVNSHPLARSLSSAMRKNPHRDGSIKEDH